jgi:hypothetical protein
VSALADFYRDGHRDALAGHGILCQHPEYFAGYREGLKDRAARKLELASFACIAPDLYVPPRPRRRGGR